MKASELDKKFDDDQEDILFGLLIKKLKETLVVYK